MRTVWINRPFIELDPAESEKPESERHLVIRSHDQAAYKTIEADYDPESIKIAELLVTSQVPGYQIITMADNIISIKCYPK